MSVLFIMMGASLLMGAGFLTFFVWAVKSGQFDDTGTPPLRMLTDDEPAKSAKVGKTKTQEKTE